MRILIFICVILQTSVYFAQDGYHYPLENLYKSYFTNDSLPFQQYKKVEIGIELPEEIQKQVDLFIKSGGKEGVNPYLEWELQVQVLFTNLKTEETDTIDAFYYVLFERYNNYKNDDLPQPRDGYGYTKNEYKDLGGWKEISRPYSFLARFVPMEYGDWKCNVLINVNLEGENKLTAYPPLFFEVVENKNNPFIYLTTDKRFLQKGKSDTVFYPIGCNISWPETKHQFDSVFYARNRYYDNYQKRVRGLPENYRSITVAPRVYEKYNEQILKINSYGANWFRIIQSPQSTEIEFEKLGNYTDRLHQAYELDVLLNLAEQNDFYLEWCMAIHYTFKIKPYHITHWDWDSSEGENIYAYKTAFGLDSPFDFFQNEGAKKYYRQRIRYILSRWGYSSQIGVFEIMSEINNIITVDENDSLFESKYVILENWQNEMTNYVKQNYFGKIHLLTGSYSGEKSKNDKSYFLNSNYDLMSSNIYQFNWGANANFWYRRIGEKILNQSNDAAPSNYLIDCIGKNCDYVFKPIVLSESEPLVSRQVAPNSTVELNRHLWQSYFSGIAYSLSWTFWYSPDNYGIFTQISDFINKSDLKNHSWHPGFMKTIPFKSDSRWVLNEKAIHFMGRKENAKADLIYLKNNENLKAIGAITNLTVNFYTEDKINSVDYIPFLDKKKKVKLKREKLRIVDLKDGKYVVYYYLPNDLDTPVYIQPVTKSKRGKLKLKHKIGSTKNDYILLFEVK